MLSSILILFAALLQQPERGAAPSQHAREATFDSSRVAVARMANHVADLRSGLDVFRRAAFNGADGDVVTTAANLSAQCRTLDSLAAVTERKVCRRCAFQPAVQEALDGYRRAMPALGRSGARCVVRLRQLSRGADVVKRLRRDARSVSNPIVLALTDYERRLDALLEVLNAKPPRPIPRRPAQRPGPP